ncbi:E3 ubiquitin-protein ligase CCNB1IP1-like [Haliotis cracherodii]|uniref:E3 ubiquitin-protein ligase CCNB1IP1-like n=1 Tax=Haliotis rufescens TaxID=6454 RepID=UPI001EB04FE7|nr:E3 ubiquitin-protein ligase CCNB1IP1-like [Haliotis rufescens]
MDGDLICNFKKCRKQIRSFAWVTSCSHVFCDEDGSREFNKSVVCPACETTLSGKCDIVRSNVQPTEQWKSMVIAGQRPEVIMEICTRALSFWTYQTHQEIIYQEYQATKHREKSSQLQQYYEQIVSKTQTELTTLKSHLKVAKKDLDSMKKKHSELAERLSERSRQYQKLQSLYESLRRRCITPATFNGCGDASMIDQTANRLQNFTMNLTTGDVLRGQNISNQGSRAPSPPERDFVFRPNNTPLLAEQSRFSLMLGTPK